jgi:putative peptidoglycan lipid II flippase
LTASAGVSGWVEFLLLRRTLNTRIGHTGLPASLTARLWTSALAAAAVAWAIKLVLPIPQPIIVALAVLVPYGVVFLGMTTALNVPEARRALARLRR